MRIRKKLIKTGPVFRRNGGKFENDGNINAMKKKEERLRERKKKEKKQRKKGKRKKKNWVSIFPVASSGFAKRINF